MKKHLLFNLLLAVLAGHAMAQSAELQRLQHENDSLRQELEKCRTSGWQGLYALALSAQQRPESGQARTVLRAQMLDSVEYRDADRYQQARQLTRYVDALLHLCDDIQYEIVRKTGGVDPDSGQPIGLRDKEITGKIMLDNGRASELKSALNLLHGVYARIPGINTAALHLENPEKYYSSTGASWEHFKFSRMPLAAVLPMLNKMRADARADERMLLEALKGK